MGETIAVAAGERRCGLARGACLLSRHLRVQLQRPVLGGISIAEFDRFKTWIAAKSIRPEQDLQITLTGVFRVHLYQVANWENEGLAEPGTFDDLVATLRQMYWGGRQPPTSWPPQKIALHARRGDVAQPNHRRYRSMGPGGVWNGKYYQAWVNQLAEEFPDSEIAIYTEAEGIWATHRLVISRHESGFTGVMAQPTRASGDHPSNTRVRRVHPHAHARFSR